MWGWRLASWVGKLRQVTTDTQSTLRGTVADLLRKLRMKLYMEPVHWKRAPIDTIRVWNVFWDMLVCGYMYRFMFHVLRYPLPFWNRPSWDVEVFLSRPPWSQQNFLIELVELGEIEVSSILAFSNICQPYIICRAKRAWAFSLHGNLSRENTVGSDSPFPKKWRPKIYFLL